MEDAVVTIELAHMRMDRALSSVKDFLDRCPADMSTEVDGTVRRVVIAMNSLAHVLQLDGAASARQVADLLWSFGEGLHMQTDGMRGS